MKNYDVERVCLQKKKDSEFLIVEMLLGKVQAFLGCF